VHGNPGQVDGDEPARIAKAIKTLELNYAVITSVDRDDLPDGGASIFAETIRATRTLRPTCRLEVLIPDFQGKVESLHTILQSKPDVLNHNLETVSRLYRTARPGGKYDRALELLGRSHALQPTIPTKSGLMVGLGEYWNEVITTLQDLYATGCKRLTIGQYLRPSPAHLPVARYYHPDEFNELACIAKDLGFKHVESGPLVRSSYHAHEQADAALT
jgi:lipoic acid synthetase